MLINKLMYACCMESGLMNGIFKHKQSNNHDEEELIQNGNVNSKPNLLPGGLGQLVKKGKFTDREMKYQLSNWRDLPMKARRAAEDLGFDQEKWDAKGYVDADYKHWWDLDDNERRAVEVLGWEENAWEHKYEHSSWADLPALQKRSAISVGFDEYKWDHDQWPENLNKKWNDLSFGDKQAMSVLGWHKAKWD